MVPAEQFDVSSDELVRYLCKTAAALTSTEQVVSAAAAFDLIAKIPSPEMTLEQLSAEQRGAVIAFMVEYFPTVPLSQYDLG